MTKLSDIQTEKQKLEGEIKDSIARRRPIENCVRSYDNVIDNEWCNNVIDLFEKSKPESLIEKIIEDFKFKTPKNLPNIPKKKYQKIRKEIPLLGPFKGPCTLP